MALPQTLNSATPASSDSPADGDNQIRDLKTYVIDVLGVPSNSAVTAAAFSISTGGIVTVSQSGVALPTYVHGPTSAMLVINTGYTGLFFYIPSGQNVAQVTQTGLLMYRGFVESPSGTALLLGTASTQSLILRTNSLNRWQVDSSGMLLPWSNDTMDLGSSSLRAKTIYARDLNLTSGSGLPVYPLRPESATFPTTNFPQLNRNSGTNWTDFTLDYDSSTAETAFWFSAIPTGITVTAADIEIHSRQASGISGNLAWLVTTLTRANTEAWDTAGVSDYVASTDVQGTLGQMLVQSRRLTTTGWAGGEAIQVSIQRPVASDTLAFDAKFIQAILRIL